MGHGDDERTEQLGAVYAPGALDELEQRPGFSRLRGYTRLGSQPGSRLRKQANQQLFPVRFGHPLVILGNPQRAQDLTQGVVDPSGILTEV